MNTVAPRPGLNAIPFHTRMKTFFPVAVMASGYKAKIRPGTASSIDSHTNPATARSERVE